VQKQRHLILAVSCHLCFGGFWNSASELRVFLKLAGTQQESYSVYLLFPESGKQAAKYFGSFQSLESLPQSILEVSRVWKACRKVFWRFPESGKLATKYFGGFHSLESLPQKS
jgi:hypothetical protein